MGVARKGTKARVAKRDDLEQRVELLERIVFAQREILRRLAKAVQPVVFDGLRSTDKLKGKKPAR